MRNLFDQFEGRENRLTHALISVLGRDSDLRRDFLKRFASDFVYDARTLHIDEQTLPGESQPRLPEERSGLPDAIMWDAHGRVLAIESKLTAPLVIDQLRRHWRALQRRGFNQICGVGIVIRPAVVRDSGWRVISWIEIYRWLGRFGSRAWADELARYIEIVETQMTDDEIDAGARLTDFSGIHFSDEKPYSYHAAKITLRSLMDAVEADTKTLRRLGLSHPVQRRQAITDQGRVWDFIGYKRPRVLQQQRGNSHTGNIHFTATIDPESATAYITVPNGAGRAWAAMRGMEFGEFRDAIGSFVNQLGKLSRTAGVTPQVHLLQRRFKNQRSLGLMDGRLTIDPRMVFEKRAKFLQPKMKPQPQWLELLHALICQKRANFQMQIGSRFAFGECRAITKPDAISLFIQAWLAGKAFLDACGISVSPAKS